MPPKRSLPYPGSVNFQSARAAFLALLQKGKPRRIWMPYYLCGTMLSSARQAGIPVAFYHIDAQFRPARDIFLAPDEWIVGVNYFGVCAEQAAALVAAFGREKVVIDASQALFMKPLDCLANIYSPRKFIGIPDGGMLVTTLPVSEPDDEDGKSYERARSLLKRLAFTPEAAYAEHQKAELSLFDQEPGKMSALTRRMLAGVDYGAVRRRRNRNFAFLHKHLGAHNLLALEPARVDGALCYPLLTRSTGLRTHLIAQRIYVPTYWKDVLELVPVDSCEGFLTRSLIPLPCDQRYGAREMERVAEVCLDFFRRTEAVSESAVHG